MTLQTYGNSYEDQRKRKALEPEFYETVEAASRAQRRVANLLRHDPEEHRHGGQPWCALPWHEGLALQEDSRLTMRAALLLGAAGVFFRVNMIYCTPDMHLSHPYALLDLAHASAGSADQAERAARFCNSDLTKDCDLDFVSLSVRKFVASSPETLLSPDILGALHRLSVVARNTTLVVESKHARRRAFWEMRHQIRGHRLVCSA